MMVSEEENDTHMCACWMEKPCTIIKDDVIVSVMTYSQYERYIGRMIGFITACGKKFYYDEKLWHTWFIKNDSISVCKMGYGSIQGNLSHLQTNRGKLISCFECRLLGSLG